MTGDNDGGGRRFLIATAVAHYRNAPQWDRPGLVDARTEIIDLFTGPLGYTHVSDLGLDPTKDQLTSQLRAFCRSSARQPSDMIAVYIAGHGEVLDDSGDHVLLTADTEPEDVDDALPTVELARKMLLGTPARRVLLMLDACYSGKGGNDLAGAALTRMTQHWGRRGGSGLVVITSAQPAEQAQTGAFPRLLRQAVEGLPTAGYAPAALALDAVVQAMNDNPLRPGFQTISATLALLDGAVPPFLPNPRHDPRMSEVDLAIQQASEWDAQAERRDLEFRTRLLVRAMAGHNPAQGWWFSGRRAALTDITRWLNHHDRDRPLLAVTAAPGSGKTAVLGLIAALTHPERRLTVPLHSLGLPDAAIPGPNTVDVVIYAQNLTTEQVLHGIAAAAHLRAEKPGELLDQLAGRTAPLTVLVDALDEAADPGELTRRVLRPLAEHAQGRLRLLVGTRPHLLDALGLRREDCIDLDGPRYADLDALTAYAARGLLDAAPDSPYQHQDPETIRTIAEAVATASEPSFLVARITSSTLAADPAVPDPRDPGWRLTLPRMPGDAMRRDLRARLGAQAERARDLLRPLAFAEGQGLPWEDIWAPLASHIAAVTYTDDDLLWLRHHAGSYVIEATESGRSAYRLYHQALAEHLRDGTHHTEIHRAFTHLLQSRVPRNSDGTRDWARAHPYIRRHLATHAARSGLLDEIITDTDYLVHAEPDELLAALHSVTTDDAHLTRAIYRASASLHRHLNPARRRQVLATDAARFAASRQHRALAEPLEWKPRWATGQQTSPALRATLTGHEGPVHTVACTTIDGEPVAVTADGDGTVRVWDLATATARAVLTGHRGRVVSVACTTIDGQPVAVTAGDERTVRVWDLATGTVRVTLTGHRGPVAAVACTTIDDQPIAVTVGREDQTVLVWDLATGTVRATLTGHRGQVDEVACTTIDGCPVAVTVSMVDKTVRVWDLVTGTARAILTGHKSLVTAVACATVDNRPVVVTAEDGKLWVWDLRTATIVATLTSHKGTLQAVACTSFVGKPVAVSAGRYDHAVRVWDLATGTVHATLTGHNGSVNAVACTTIDGQPIVVTVGGDDRAVRLWDVAFAYGQQVPDAGHSADITGAACTIVDGRSVVITADDHGTVRMWDLATGTARGTLTGHKGGWAVWLGCTTIDGRSVAVTAGRYDRKLQVWDLAAGTDRAIPTGHDGPVDTVACTTLNGQPVAVTVGYGRVVRVSNLTTGASRAVLRDDVAAVACTTFDGESVVVTAGGDGTVRVWDLATGTARVTLTGHDGPVAAVACTTFDGESVVVTAGGDGTVRVWDLATGTARVTLTGHDGPVAAVACTTFDGQPAVVTAGGDDHTVRVWNLTTSSELAVLDYDGRKAGPLCIGPGQEIVVGIGWDLVVIDTRPNSQI
ncbi:caspase family protein [Amycolatopsis sp. WAC 01416]|uniref:caspase family protein n=1 Tax=Amycolatopsis sp. WAC 01416 TaxID=2203196 RepID=UPI0013159764|nr:caspase family protein [Amycolatopsis sp. WAC 01416]